MIDVKIENSWKNQLINEFSKPYFTELINFIKQEYQKHKIFPKGQDIFKAFDLCNFSKTKVVILGQDPYHGENQANGLCFAVNNGQKLPPSLQNIWKEIEADFSTKTTWHGDLKSWANQGVLLLNATLTVRANSAGSHQKKGWEEFTDAVIKQLSTEKSNLVFILWGKYAQAKGQIIDKQKHLILEAAHPSPFSAHNGFFGCKHFSKTNNYLIKTNQTPINWTN